MTGADGKFKIGGLGQGKYSLEGGGWDPSGNAANKLLTGGDGIPAGTAGVRLVATEGLKITGIVVDEQGVGLANVQIGANGPDQRGNWHHAQSGKDGKFEIVGLAAGKYALNFTAGGRAQKSVADIAAGTPGLRVELTKGQQVTGRIIDASGKALSGVQVQLTRTDGEGNGWAVTNNEGRFASNDIAPGTYKVSAHLPRAGEPNSTETKELGTVRAGDPDVEFTVR